MPDGSVVISMNVLGDLRGLLTLTLVPGTGDTFKGTWAFAADYLEDLRADGSAIPPGEHAEHLEPDNPDTPAPHREYVRLAFDGALSGPLESATVRKAPDGRVYAIETATLTIADGTLKFSNATGSGRIGSWPTYPGAITLLLNF